MADHTTRQAATAPERDDGLQAAIEAAGGVAPLAQKLGLTRVSVWRWKRVPAERVLLIETALNGTVSRHQMRPDLYPHPDIAA